MNVLLTGGTGYIASHTAVMLTEAGHNVVLFDNLTNSNELVIDKLFKITGVPLSFIQGDIRDTNLLASTLKFNDINAVIHFAGLKAVGESVQNPLNYYDNNLGGTISLLKAMAQANIKKLVFSSSATVYGNPQYLPIDEDHPRSTTNPYGRTKLQIENMLEDLSASNPSWRIACLRYFNPVGAHDSGLIGEDPEGVPNNLMPYLTRVAAGTLPYLNVFGGDYDTIDGTGVRDYIHVMDLAEGHLAALNYLERHTGLHPFNLGTGTGYSVLEVIQTFEAISSKSIQHQVVERRSGDSAASYAKVEKSQQYLNWRSSRNLVQMCESAWNYQSGKMQPKSKK